jgi:hypothetical protein
MFAVSVYMMFMGGFYDRKLISKLPEGAILKDYAEAAPGTEMANALNAAKTAAGPEIINATLTIPLILIVAFAGLFIYMRGRKKPELLKAANV